MKHEVRTVLVTIDGRSGFVEFLLDEVVAFVRLNQGHQAIILRGGLQLNIPAYETLSMDCIRRDWLQLMNGG